MNTPKPCHPDLPILYNYNVNFGHAEPIGVLPYGVKCRLDAGRKTFTLLEPSGNQPSLFPISQPKIEII